MTKFYIKAYFGEDIANVIKELSQFQDVFIEEITPGTNRMGIILVTSYWSNLNEFIVQFIDSLRADYKNYGFIRKQADIGVCFEITETKPMKLF